MNNYTGNEAEWVDSFPGMHRRTLADGEKLMLVQVKLEKGAIVPRHQHPHEQVSHSLSGRVRFVVNDHPAELTAGQTIRFPSDAPHEAHALEESLVLDVFSPPREDFR